MALVSSPGVNGRGHTTFSRSAGGAPAIDHRTQYGGIPVTADREQLAVRNSKAGCSLSPTQPGVPSNAGRDWQAWKPPPSPLPTLFSSLGQGHVRPSPSHTFTLNPKPQRRYRPPLPQGERLVGLTGRHRQNTQPRQRQCSDQVIARDFLGKAASEKTDAGTDVSSDWRLQVSES